MIADPSMQFIMGVIFAGVINTGANCKRRYISSTNSNLTLNSLLDPPQPWYQPRMEI